MSTESELERIRNKFLQPSRVLPDPIRLKSLRRLDREWKWDRMMYLDVPGPTLDLQLNFDAYGRLERGRGTNEVYVECEDASGGDPSSSNSFKRQPDKYKYFARGTTRHVPFEFGGLEDLGTGGTDTMAEGEDVELIADGEWRLVPPGFQRGLFDVSTADVQVKPLVLDDLLLEDLDQLDINDKDDARAEAAQEPKVTESQGSQPVDEILDAVPDKIRPHTAKSMAKKTWAHMLDVTMTLTQEQFRHYVPEMAKQYPFELDTFQKHAVMHLERGESVFVAAHTSAGKTVVAEYAIALAQKHMTRAIYTSPIKALSNQKFRDFRITFGEDDVGLLTGDVQIRPEAPCVIMTTEILRSMLYRGADMIRDVEFVIFDEVHYINDLERGVVWEEVIIMLPAHVTIILLSATVPNTFEFADWVGRTKKKNIYVISTQKRPVPLEHHLFVSTLLPHQLIKVVDAEKRFLQDGYKKAWDSVYVTNKDKMKEKEDKNKKKGVPQKTSFTPTFKNDRNIWINLVNLLRKQTLLPVVLFTFSKKRCEEYVDTLSNLDLLNSNEKSEVHVFIERSLMRLKGTDRELPQILRMRNLLGRGIGVHHSGLLPIVKELVEILFARNLLKVLFATETFAMGVNMPAKSVVYTGIRKHDGREFRDLLPGEYTQMSGRAGRRGLDDTGVVIIAAQSESDFPDASVLQRMILGQPTRLESQFRLTYNMILNLMRVESFKVEDMMKRSFFEDEAQRDLPEQQRLLKEHESRLAEIPKLSCNICLSDLDELYRANSSVIGITREMMNQFLVNSAIWPKMMVKGRVIIVHQGTYRNCVAVVLKLVPGVSDEDRQFECMVLKDSRADSQFDALPVLSVQIPPNQFAIVESVNIRWNHILFILAKKASVDDGPEKLQSELLGIGNELLGSMKRRHVFHELELEAKIKDFEFRQNAAMRKQLLQSMLHFNCIHCPDFGKHYNMAHEMNSLKDTLAHLQFQLSDKNLYLLPDYHQRLEVLKTMSYVTDGTVQLKGRIACEINSGDSIVLTELIMENVLTGLAPNEILALLAAFVFQEKSTIQTETIIPKLPQSLQNAIQTTMTIVTKVGAAQKEVGLPIAVDDFIKETVNFGLTEVVYEWARGTSFKQITELTDILEGSIVRAITRLDELCREVRDAARVIGNANLYRMMEEGSALIKRDIVFAASLYT